MKKIVRERGGERGDLGGAGEAIAALANGDVEDELLDLDSTVYSPRFSKR